MTKAIENAQNAAPKARFEITDAEQGRVKTDKATRELLNELKAYGRNAEERGPKAIKAGWDMLGDVMTDADILEAIGGKVSFPQAKRALWKALQPFAKARIEEEAYEEAAAEAA